jgi:prepilin-type N-terminal cleavage/methylation domain-containing protein
VKGKGVPVKSARGFTLLEILVAVAIIAILLTMAYVGMRSVGTGAKIKQTQIILGNSRALMSDFLDATKGTKRPQPAEWDYNDKDGAAVHVGTALITSNGLNFWTRPDFVDANGDNVRQEGESIVPLKAPGSVEPGSPAYSDYQLGNTRIALKIMSRLPSVNKMLSDLPADSREKASGDFPLLLDGWGHPLLFVPGGGLMGVERAGTTANTVANPLKSPDERPFWASAGADGDFSKGDDNLYSFEN